MKRSDSENCLRAVVVLAVAALALSPSHGSVADDHSARLAAGEVVVSSEPVVGSDLRIAIGSRVIDGAPERVVRALADYAHYEEWMPFLEESRILSSDARSTEVVQRLDLPAPLGTRRFRVRFESASSEGKSRVAWRFVPGSGDLREHYGSFVVSAFAPNRTLVTCRLVLDPGDVGVWLANRTAEKSVPWILDGLRQTVNRSRYDAAR